jgi:WW domain
MASNGSSSNPNDDNTSSLLRELSFWDIGATTRKPETDGVREKNSNSSENNAVKAEKPKSQQNDLEEAAAANWRTATDPATGKIYYYDVITRKTQWEKVSVFCERNVSLVSKHITTAQGDSNAGKETKARQTGS